MEISPKAASLQRVSMGMRLAFSPCGLWALRRDASMKPLTKLATTLLKLSGVFIAFARMSPYCTINETDVVCVRVPFAVPVTVTL